LTKNFDIKSQESLFENIIVLSWDNLYEEYDPKYEYRFPFYIT